MRLHASLPIPIWSRYMMRCGRSSICDDIESHRRSERNRRGHCRHRAGGHRKARTPEQDPSDPDARAAGPDPDAAGLPLRTAEARLRQGAEDGFTGTDESSLVERLEQMEVSVVAAAIATSRSPTQTDMDLARLFHARSGGTQGVVTRMFEPGMGWDNHRIASGRPLIIGGVRIESEFGLEGHSDADVLSHAITDAMLGPPLLGDIGMHFPDTDPQWKGADSLAFLRHACAW